MSLALSRDASVFLLVLLLGVVAIMTWGYFTSRQAVVISANGQETTLWTRQTTVRGALTEAGLAWNPQDIIRPGLEEALPSDGRIYIRVAVPISIEADGDTLQRLTQSTTIAGVLQESGIRLKPRDRVYLNGRVVDPEANLPGYAASFGRVSIPIASPQAAQVAVERAVPISINDNGLVSTIFTTAPTLGAALRDAGVLVYLGDYLSPDLGSPISAGESVFIRRSRAASISVDGRVIKTRTRGASVADLLAQEGVTLEGKDYASPGPADTLLEGMSVNVTRVREVFITETQTLPFETRWLPNPDMELDTRATPQAGAKGIKNRLFKLVYQNGKLVSRGLEREWIATSPQDKIINYGTKIVTRDLTLPDGKVVHYWRLMRMLATSYTAATSGKPRTHPEYGLTYLGLTAGRGIVAVDPRVINLRANVYVPGYGLALAGDTGGSIKGRHIDLGFPEANLDWWYRWVDVFVLTPVPPTNQINFVLSDYPQERNREK